MESLTTIIGEVVGKIIDPIGRQVGYLIHYKTNLDTLRDQLEKLEAAKDRVKKTVDEVERKGNQRVHIDVLNWRREADNMTREAQAILEGVDQANTKCLHGMCPNPISFHRLSRRSKKMVQKIERHEEKKEFANVSYNIPVPEICAIPSQEYMAFESRISIVKEIMEEFKNPNTNMIGVYGLGGVGKTTLAKEVFRQATEEKIFDDLVIILNVKEKQDLEKVQKEIVEKLDMDVSESQTMEVRARYLWNRVKDKKTLVILDDILERIDLEAVGLLHAPTCKLLLTSRDHNVLFSDMRTQKNFRLELLTEAETWSLFEKMADDAVKDDLIRKVATQVAKKCGGLPVLIVAVASALRNSSLGEWKDALRRFERFDNNDLAEKAYLGLEWSYNQLDAKELKPLFLLCGIIAGRGSCIIDFGDLLKYTMGLGLVKNVSTVEEARDALLSLTNKLKVCCLLLHGYDDGVVRMHELVRDVAIRITSSTALSRGYGDEVKEWPNKDFLKTCTKISLIGCNIPKLPEVPWVCPELELFILESNSIDNSLQLPDNYFEGMSKLGVLDLTNLQIPSLPSSLKYLTNLQTLCLDFCVLGDIALVGMLTNLKILSLLKSKVKELPKEISQLTRLQLLDLTGCSELEVISRNVISSLTRLEDLRMGRDSFKRWEGEGVNGGANNASIGELKHLSQLTALEIHVPDANILPANLFSDKLERYTILIGDCWHLPYFYRASSNMLKLKLATSNQVDEGIKYLLNKCEHLSLDGVGSASIISYLLDTEQGPYKQLKHLHVQNSDEVRYVMNSSITSWRSSSDDNAFPILESLSLENLVNLESVCCGQLVGEPLQKLNSLTLKNLPKFIGFSSKGSTRTHQEIISENEISRPTELFTDGMVDLMANITSLILHQCDGLRSLFSCSMATSLVQLKHLEISKCESLMNIFPASVAKSLQQLRHLKVENCKMLEEIVVKEDGIETRPEFIFPKATFVAFIKLPKLKYFYPGLHVSKWPLLNFLEFFECENVEIFASEFSRFQEKRDELISLGTPIKQPFFLGSNSFSNLEVLRLDPKTEIWYEAYGPLPAELFNKLKSITFSGADPNKSFSFIQKLPNLEELIVYGGPPTWNEIFVYHPPPPQGNGNGSGNSNSSRGGEICAVRSGSLPHVKKLWLARMQELLHLGNDYDSQPVFPNLEILRVHSCLRLQNLGSSAISFLNLTTLHVSACNGLKYLITYSVAKILKKLKKLEVECCLSIVEIIAASNGDDVDDSDSDISFSCLQHLKLHGLPSFRGFCSENYIVRVPCLNTLDVQYCKSGKFKISPDGLLLVEEILGEDDDEAVSL